MEHLRITVAGKVYEVLVEKVDSSDTQPASPPARVAAAATVAPPQAPPPQAPPPQAPPPPPAPPARPGEATSPLAGIVQAIEGEVGHTVREGDRVITLEAMKMYTAINAPMSGQITSICVKVGDSVEEGQLLYTIA